MQGARNKMFQASEIMNHLSYNLAWANPTNNTVVKLPWLSHAIMKLLKSLLKNGILPQLENLKA